VPKTLFSRSAFFRTVFMCGTLVVSGCMPFGLGAPKADLTSVSLYRGDVTVTAPAKYCIDARASRLGAGFVVISNCATVAGDASRQSPPGIITVQVGDPDTASVDGEEEDLAEFLMSDRGLDLLGAVPSNVESTEGLVEAYFADGGDFPVDGMQADEWRAFVDVGSRLVTLRIRASRSLPISSDQAHALLDAMIQGLSVGSAS